MKVLIVLLIGTMAYGGYDIMYTLDPWQAIADAECQRLNFQTRLQALAGLEKKEELLAVCQEFIAFHSRMMSFKNYFFEHFTLPANTTSSRALRDKMAKRRKILCVFYGHLDENYTSLILE